MAGPATVQQSSQGFATIPNQYASAFASGWALDQRLDAASATGGFVTNTTPSSSSTFFTSTGDGTTGASGTGLYSLGRRTRVIQAASTAYGRVLSASVLAGLTTVTLTSFTTSISTGLTTGAITSAAVGAVIKDTDINPINTSGDLVYGSSNGTLARLPVGTTGSLLVASTGVPTWLAPGTTGTLLSIVGAVPVWVSLLGTAASALSADVQSTSTGTFKDIVSVALTTGTWWVTSNTNVRLQAGDGALLKLWDGTTTLASVELSPAAGTTTFVAANLATVVPVPVATTWKLSGVATQAASTSTTYKAATQSTGQGNNATQILGMKISAST